MRQAACGENHTVFLMNSGCVLTCGSNEFGQLGLQQDAAAGEGATGQGGQGRFNTPTLIEKTILDSVVFVAAGRFHTMAVRKQTEGDALKEEEHDEEGGANLGATAGAKMHARGLSQGPDD